MTEATTLSSKLESGEALRLRSQREKMFAFLRDGDLTPFFGPPVMRVCGRGQHAIGGRMLLGFGS